MKSKDKILIAGVLVFVLIEIGLAYYDKNVCNPEWRSIEENLEYIKTANSVVQIKLYGLYSDYDVNLVNDTVTITDIGDIEAIRKMVNGKYTGTWNRPMASWHTQMKLILDNKRTFEFRVSKISNDRSDDMTHMYFGSKHCGAGSPNCSETLGKYLENLTGYRIKGKQEKISTNKIWKSWRYTLNKTLRGRRPNVKSVLHLTLR